jgi:hypothetical protein
VTLALSPYPTHSHLLLTVAHTLLIMSASIKYDALPVLDEAVNLHKLVKTMWTYRDTSLKAAEVMKDRELWAALTEEEKSNVRCFFSTVSIC